MRLLITSILLITLTSCGTTQRDGWQLASEFHTNYANEFIQNTELLKYSYNPRAHFYFNTRNEEPTFRALIHDTTKLRVIIFANQERFLQEFGLEIDSIPTFGRATIWNENEGLKLQADDSLMFEIIRYDKNPLEQFNYLKNLVNKYGIVTYGELRIGGIIEVYLTTYDYLIYYPTNYKISEPQFEEHWRNKQKNGRKLDKNWYYYKSEKPLDLG
ncbi:hypothetical protein [Marinigracilibium pacificum]|uniref:Lipoprotein n=1 Tax=Marinigracilibium pacificum TaxID=2729599 RepID=A0A848IT43_9BACT|nr:hypothetical protein [Marinigracilibium pacificum]NMM47633.1 hypothetical protein [Marinigracilibium pacificum]